MATESEELAKRFKKTMEDAASAAKKMADFAEDLDNKTLDKFTESAKKALRATGELGKEIADAATDFRQVTKAVDEMEKAFKDLADLEERHAKKLTELEKKYSGNLVALANARREAELELIQKKAERAELGKTLEGLKTFTKEIEETNTGLFKFRTSMLKTSEEVRKNLSFGALGDHFRNKITSAAKSTLTWGTALGFVESAMKKVYADLLQVSNLGLGSMFYKLRTDAALFGLTLEEYTNILQKNRSSINLLGGGIEGVGKFNTMLNEGLSANQELVNRLGRRGASQAISNFTGALQTFGTTAGSESFKGALKETSDTFLELNAMYGTQAQEFEDYNKQLMASEQMQRRLNALSKEEQLKEQQRLMLMTKELAARGLSLQQIADFNAKLEAIYDPTKSKFETRQKEALGLQLWARQLQSQGGAVNMQLVDQAAEAMRQGNLELVKQLQPELSKTLAGAKATVSAEAAKGSAGRLGPLGYEVTGRFEDMAGSFAAVAQDMGTAMNTATTQMKDLGGANSALYQSALAANEAMAHVPDGVANLREGLEVAIRLWESGIGDAVKALGIFTLAVGGSGIISAVGSLGKGLFGLAGLITKIPGLGFLGKGALAGAGTAGAAGAALGVGAAAVGGYALGTAAYEGNWFGIQTGLASATDYLFKSDAQKKLEENERKEKERVAKMSRGARPTAPATTTSAAPSSSTGSTGKKIVQVLDSGPGFTTVKYDDGSTEKRTGTAAQRNNNPGNLRDSRLKIGTANAGTSGTFAVFPDVQTGMQAQQQLLTSGAYRNLTVSQAIAKYSPPSENDTGSYQRAVLSVLGGQDKKMGDLSSQELSAVMAKIHEHEGFKGGASGTPVPPTLAGVNVNTSGGISGSKEPTNVIDEMKKQTAALFSIDRKIGQVPPAYKPNQRAAGENA